MRFVFVAMLLVVLTGCASTDPDVLRSEADRIERGHARATAEAVARHIEQTAQAEAATIEARDRESHEARLVLDYAAATVSAIQSDQYRLDLALSAREATLDAWDSSLRVTQTMAGIQATQTVQPTALAAAMQSARARADMMQVGAVFFGQLRRCRDRVCDEYAPGTGACYAGDRSDGERQGGAILALTLMGEGGYRINRR